jgi:elongation factor P hydroxylase
MEVSQMKTHNQRHRIFVTILLFQWIFLMACTFGFAAKKKDADENKNYVMTETALQSELMSYADRFASGMTQAVEDFDKFKPDPETRHFIMGDGVYSISSVYTIAAEPNPQVALLDMVTLTTLGRLIYEDNMRQKYGEPIEVIIKGYRKLEGDIWKIAAKILSNEQQLELRALILEWKKRNPDQVVYNYVRFSDFAADRRTSTLVKKGKTGGLFKSVQQVTQEVEETRMLAERSLYLATRLPLLTGNFAETWMSQMILNPQIQSFLADVDNLSGKITEERKATVEQVMKEVSDLREVTIDQVMKRVSIERKAAIVQLMDRFAIERKQSIEDILSEEKRMTGLMTQLRQTISAANELVTSTNTLAGRFAIEAGAAVKETPSEPFDIKDYQATLVEASKVIQQTDTLVKTIDNFLLSPDWEKSLPRFIEALNSAQTEGEEWVNHAFLVGAGLILFFFFTLFVYRFAAARILDVS